MLPNSVRTRCRTHTYNPSISSCKTRAFCHSLLLTVNRCGRCVHAASTPLPVTVNNCCLLPGVPGIFPGTKISAAVVQDPTPPGRHRPLCCSHSGTEKPVRRSLGAGFCQTIKFRAVALRNNCRVPSRRFRSVIRTIIKKTGTLWKACMKSTDVNSQGSTQHGGMSVKPSVSIPRQSRGPYDVSRSKRLLRGR